MTSTERLVAALREANAPTWLIEKAEKDRYHDFKSTSATPGVDLVTDSTAAGLIDVADRAIRGEFDAGKEEAQAWAAEARKDPAMAKILGAIEEPDS